jgi:hypothetical protein
VATAVLEPCILFKVLVPEFIFCTVTGASGLVKKNSSLRSFFFALLSWFLTVASGPPQLNGHPLVCFGERLGCAAVFRFHADRTSTLLGAKQTSSLISPPGEKIFR